MLLLLFQVGEDRYGLDATIVREVVPLVELRSAPQAELYVAGWCNYRGMVTPVLDLSALIAGRRSASLLSTRIIVVDYVSYDEQIHALGLCAEKVTETVSCRSEDFQPPGVVPGSAPYLREILLDTQGMIQRVEIAELLPADLRQRLFAVPGTPVHELPPATP